MKYRIAAVKYINTLPFIQGLNSPQIRDHIEVLLAHPAQCAELLQKGEVDIALCPVGALTEMDAFHVITDYCIGCDGPVRTVSLYSNKPLAELKHVILSSESRTSNLLVQLINREYWRYNFDFLPDYPISPVSPVSPGFLFIGDICFQKEKEFAYRTDLGLTWKEWTGLPFAFAVWVSRETIEQQFVDKLSAAFKEGIKKIDDLEYPGDQDAQLLRRYLKQNISFDFDEKKKIAMRRFLEMI